MIISRFHPMVISYLMLTYRHLENFIFRSNNKLFRPFVLDCFQISVYNPTPDLCYLCDLCLLHFCSHILRLVYLFAIFLSSHYHGLSIISFPVHAHMAPDLYIPTILHVLYGFPCILPFYPDSLISIPLNLSVLIFSHMLQSYWIYSLRIY